MTCEQCSRETMVLYSGLCAACHETPQNALHGHARPTRAKARADRRKGRGSCVCKRCGARVQLDGSGRRYAHKPRRANRRGYCPGSGVRVAVKERVTQ